MHEPQEEEEEEERVFKPPPPSLKQIKIPLPRACCEFKFSLSVVTVR